MKNYETMLLPHCVYKVFAGDALLYVGCSRNIGARLSHHGSVRPWYTQITRIEVEWFENEPKARIAEARLIADGAPLHNVLVADPSKVYEKSVNLTHRAPRGDGTKCPACGAMKERRKDAYCRPCMRDYQRKRRALAAGS